MARCLVTGGAGFIGSNLVDTLIGEGHEVFIVDDLSAGKEEYVNSKAKFYKVDITTPEIDKVFSDFGPFDHIFHLAAQVDVRKSVKDPVFDNKVNTLGSYRIFELGSKSKAKRVIFISTGGALYGECEKPAKEDALIKPTSPYAIHKYAAERYLEVMQELYGLDYIVLRLANVYGQRQYKGGECGVVGIFTHNAVNDLPCTLFGDGTKTRDFVHVDDIIKAILAARDTKYSGVFNIGSGKEVNIMQIVKMIEDMNGRKLDLKMAENKPGEVKRSVLNYDKANTLLGWEPSISFKDGISKTLKWLKEESS